MSTAVVPRDHHLAEQAAFNSLAAIALALSFVTIIGGIVCGHVALSQIARSGERGRWMAVLALVIGYGIAIGTALLVIGLPLGAFVLHLAR
ncbi:DUF4190 domain-containing protein [Amnibacterium kyonggiense]|uniref:Uncharacterized protein DUF4190 n=1 Tax=Amnibacterium kyonggiense TaxID=595671 RepID=A0A4R7FS37_9MICO|nr:DUF4190 domain-containing protein [Amnibacterium kyonggiense]TDS80586.1 uncharacterized protein DUF4190 [Amnibacterium kyonggiense]